MVDDRSIREYLLSLALEEEKRNRKLRRVFGWVMVAGVLVLMAGQILMCALLGPEPSDAAQTLAVIPASILFAIGFVGYVAHSRNSVMEV